MRRRVHRSGVTILDHHPALELLVGPDGAVAGAAGVARQRAGVRWQCRAGAVVLATGGCAFLSKAYGLDVADPTTQHRPVSSRRHDLLSLTRPAPPVDRINAPVTEWTARPAPIESSRRPTWSPAPLCRVD
jgi:hypothetical protein